MFRSVGMIAVDDDSQTRKKDEGGRGPHFLGFTEAYKNEALLVTVVIT